jgi:hypothetical protein
MKLPIVYCTFFICLSIGSAWSSEVSSTEIEALREQVRLLSERLDELERRAAGSGAADETAAPAREQPMAPQLAAQPAQPTPSAAAHATSAAGTGDAELDRRIDQAVDTKVDEKMAAVSWAERLRWAGDFRYRYETLSIEDENDRNRNRIRARANMEAKVSDTVKVALGIATGGEDPVSTNQTLGGGGSKKPISLDLAYFEWTGLPDTKVVGGKFKQQHHSAGDFGLIWDSDWRPEGTSIRYDKGNFYAVGIGTWLESDSSSAQEDFSFGAQAGLQLPLGEELALAVGAGYYQFDASGKSSFFGDDDFFGNSFNPVTGTYLYDYHEAEVFTELEFHLFDRRTLLFADYVQNLDVDQHDRGYAFGVKYGQARARGTWEMNYAWKKLEADAVLGLLADSDFGEGGTDAKGSVISGAYAILDNWSFRLTYFLTETQLASDDPQDVERLQLDLQFNYQ